MVLCRKVGVLSHYVDGLTILVENPIKTSENDYQHPKDLSKIRRDSTTFLAAASPLKYAPAAVPISSSGAVCSPANQIDLAGHPILILSTHSSAFSIPT